MRRARLEEDPHRIPEMGMQEYGQKKVAFVSQHPDVLLTEFREPHKRFVERLDRDFTIHEVVPPYELGEVRLRSEYIAQKGGLASSAEQLLRAAREDIPATVVAEDDAINRITAFYIALEYQGHCKFAFFAGSAEKDNLTGGPLTFIKELETRRREAPGVHYIVLVDRRFRKKIHELLVESRVVYSSFSAALWEVFHNHRYIWSDARIEAREAAGDDSTRRTRPEKREREPETAKVHEDNDTKGPSKNASKRHRQKERQRATAKASTANARPLPLPESVTKRVPEVEWKAIQKVGPPKLAQTCRFWNLTCGCKESSGCRFKHVCWVCGGDHKWCVRHFSA